MASVKDLKKDINNVLGDIIEAVYIVEASNDGKNSKDGEKIIDEAIATFDDLIHKVNQRKTENRSKHLKEVRVQLEERANALAEKVNKLA